MSAVSLNDAAHPHRRNPFEKGTRDDGVGLCDRLATAGDGEDAVVDALDDFADTGLNTGFIAEVCNILASLADDNTGLLRRHDCAQRQLGLRIFFVGLGDDFAVGAEAVVIDLHMVGEIRDIVAVGAILSRHFRC